MASRLPFLVVFVAALLLATLLAWPATLPSPLAASLPPLTLPLGDRALEALQRTLEEARDLCRSGRYAQGAALLAAPITARTPRSVQQEVALALARCRFLNGEIAEAAAAARRGLELDAASPALLLLLAEAESRLGNHRAVLPLARRLVQESPALEGYGRLLEARAALALGEFDTAMAALSTTTGDSAPLEDARALWRQLAQVLREASRFEESTSAYERALELATARWEQAELRAILGGLARELGHQEEAKGYWWAVLEEAYDLAPAQEALAALEMMAPASVSDYMRGLVLFYADRNAEAAAAFTLALAAGPGPDGEARTRYFRALAQRDQGLPAKALASLEELVERFPTHDVADNALWQRAQIYERQEAPAPAAEAYARLLSSYPQSPFAAEARLRLGLSRYRRGAVAEALTQWEALASPGPSWEYRSQAAFWVVKGALALGQRARAQAALGLLEALDHDGYFTLRARELLGGEAPWPNPLLSRPLAMATSAPLSATGPQPGSPVATTASHVPPRARGERALLLLEAGLLTAAQSEAAALLQEDLSPEELNLWAMRFSQIGLPSMALRAAYRLERGSSSWDGEFAADPRFLYPLAYQELVEQEAQRYGLDPRLLLAVVRQESAFNPVARSSADALGLTQVIPSTGRDIAARLEMAPFAPEHLLRPEVSLRFGAYYLASMLRQFDGDLLLALAAYNGGPGNVARHRATFEQYDPDLFQATFPLAETRLYVSLVLAYYARYAELYPLAES